MILIAYRVSRDVRVNSGQRFVKKADKMLQPHNFLVEKQQVINA